MRRLLLLVLLVSGSGACYADFNKGLSCYEVGNYECALWQFCKAAEQGDVSAKGNIEFMFLNGQGVTQNDKEAVKWFRKADGRRLYSC